MKKVLKAVLILILVILVAVAALLGWLTATEYRPEAVEQVSVSLAGDVDTLKSGR